MLGAHSNDPSTLINKALQKAEKNAWIEAADLCRLALSLVENLQDKWAVASLNEFSSKCFFKAAFQASERDQFKRLMTESRKAAEDAHAFHETAHHVAKARMAETRSKTAKFWIQDDPKERLILARSIVESSEEAARLLEQTEKPDLAFDQRTEVLSFYKEFINLSTDFRSLKGFFDEATALGRTLLKMPRTQVGSGGVIETLSSIIWCLAVEAQVILPPSEFQSLSKETQDLDADLLKAAIKAGSPTALCQAGEAKGHVNFNVIGDSLLGLQNYEESLATAIPLADRLLIGRLQWECSQTALWLGSGQLDRRKKDVLLRKGERFARDSIKNLEIPFQTTELSAAHTSLARCLVELANLAGTDLKERRRLLDQALEVAERATRFESETWAWSRAASALSGVLYFLARIETSDQKIKLLERALDVRERLVRVNESLFPHFWNNVIAPYNAALVRSEIADLESDQETRKKLLIRAASEMDLCLERGRDWGTNPGFIYRLAQHCEAYGDILSKLYSTTLDTTEANKSIKAFEKSIQGFRKSKGSANVAELEWKIAKIHNDLHSYQLAADAFQRAAQEYRTAIGEVPGSAPLYEDLAKYLDAWSIIESARLHHEDGEYRSASDLYSNASKLLEKSRESSHLSTMFLGRSFLEKGEAQSAGENHTQATESFRTAGNRFREETEQLQKKLRETGIQQERRELENWLEIAKQRESYCNARLELEEARALDQQGDKAASAKKFHGSAKTLTSLATRVSDDQERAELDGLAKFCEGWAQMKQAEAHASAEAYLKAAEAFVELRLTQTRPQFLYLALANAAICKALGAGTMFQETRDAQHYSEVKRQTEAAADYFRLAGFKRTEAWTRATQRLYDSLIFVTDAESERDPSKKTELYELAENQLRLAAQLYGEAGFPVRKAEATNQLTRVKEQKRILLAPLTALSEIPTATASSITLSPRGRGQPLGAQRFDEAYVVGDVNIQHREVTKGSTFTVDLEIANVGKSTATLVKLQNVLAEGLEPEDEQRSQISSDGGLDLLGRTLEHLKTHVIKIQTKANRDGEIELRPRLFYVDDSGAYKTYQFSPATLTVHDIGSRARPISTASPTTTGITLGTELRFETDRSREVFQRLTREFLLDYMSKRLYVEKAGWRSLVQTIRETKIPRSSLYGPRGRDGPVLVELERRGLIESRIFPKERGRGGAVKKIRVAYDNEIVKKLIEQMVASNSGR